VKHLESKRIVELIYKRVKHLDSKRIVDLIY